MCAIFGSFFFSKRASAEARITGVYVELRSQLQKSNRTTPSSTHDWPPSLGSGYSGVAVAQTECHRAVRDHDRSGRAERQRTEENRGTLSRRRAFGLEGLAWRAAAAATAERAGSRCRQSVWRVASNILSLRLRLRETGQPVQWRLGEVDYKKKL